MFDMFDLKTDEGVRAALQMAVVQCSERCLYQSAKWCAELLNSLREENVDEDAPMTTPTQQNFPTFPMGNHDPEEAALEANEWNKYMMAKSFFDCREFDRCAAVFLPDNVLSGVIAASANMTSDDTAKDTKDTKNRSELTIGTAPPVKDPKEPKPKEPIPKLSQKALFLALYAKMMAGEKRKDEEMEMVMGPHDSGKTINKELTRIRRFLQEWFEERGAGPDGNHVGSQGWLEYLYGVVLSKDRNETEALAYLSKSVSLYPMNWGCWLEITNLVNRNTDLNEVLVGLPRNLFAMFFWVHCSLELYHATPAIETRIKEFSKQFPDSGFLISAQAMFAHNAHDFETAAMHFSQLLAKHPLRLDSMDHYSNVLYVMGNRPRLAFLAHLCDSIDKFRPETCVVIGNYYSQISHHEKAVNYFRRALTLDRTFLSAWTLMGHEYVELKNTHAAIEAYRRAVDVNRHDYRAWYGLGQTYEVLEMHAYALWYYKRSCGLRPWDSKMWAAVGSCLQKLERWAEGIKAFKRALLADTGSGAGPGIAKDESEGLDTEVCYHIATMYEKLSNEAEAKGWMELCVNQEDGYDDDEASELQIQAREEGGTGVTIWTSKARMWLAKKAMEKGEWEQALIYAMELCSDGQDVEEAKALVRDLRARGLEPAAGGAAPVMARDPDVSGLLSSP